MTLVTEDRGAVRVITYANPPFGTMTGAGSSEMFDAMTAAARDQAVRVIIITGGMPGVFIRHYDVGELSQMVMSFWISGGSGSLVMLIWPWLMLICCPA